MLILTVLIFINNERSDATHTERVYTGFIKICLLDSVILKKNIHTKNEHILFHYNRNDQS